MSSPQSVKELVYWTRIVDYEQGETNNEETLVLFSELIETGWAWKLQGHYGRTARQFIDSGLIQEDGMITDDGWDWAFD